MRKLVKLLAITTIFTTTTLQVTACKDDTKHNTFINDVNKSKNNNTAFFGFLGSADDDNSSHLQASFDWFNSKTENGNSKWYNLVHGEEWSQYLTNFDLKDISLHYYQGPPHQDKSSDIIDSFWNQKNVTWQKNIFNWIYNNTKKENNPEFKKPLAPDELGVKELTDKKDANNKNMFANLPVVFIVSKGKLITAGENWNSANTPAAQEEAIKNFVMANLFQ